MIEEEGYIKLNPKARISRYIRSLFFIIIFVAIGIACYVLLEEKLLAFAILGVCVIGIIYFLIEPEVYYRRYRYRISDDCIEVRKGVIVLRHNMVPIERVHQVEVSRGPINYKLKLANLVVTTAGGVATIDYLDLDVAESIAVELNKIVNSIIRGREADA